MRPFRRRGEGEKVKVKCIYNIAFNELDSLEVNF